MNRLQSRKTRQEPTRGERCDRCEPDRAAVDAQRFNRRLYAQDGVAQPSQKCFPIVRWRYVSAFAVQQARADQSLEVANQMRHSRTRNAELSGCTHETALMGNGAKRFDSLERGHRHR
jgi:hypothetical protein